MNTILTKNNKEINKNTRKLIKSRMVNPQWIEDFKSKTSELRKGSGTSLSKFKDVLNKVLPSKETEGVDYIIMNGVKQYI